MLKSFIALWVATQELLLQIVAIKGKIADDVTTINRALTVYKSFLMLGFTDYDIDHLLRCPRADHLGHASNCKYKEDK